MERHIDNVLHGAVGFTGVYLSLKSLQRFGNEFNFPNKDQTVSSKVCTWAMGALGAGLTFAVLLSLVNK